MSPILRGSVALFALAAAPFAAFAEEAGTVQSVSGGQGSVTVVRGGSTNSLSASEALYEGDKIITGSDGASTLSVFGCTISLSAMQSLTVAPGSCEQIAASVAGTSIASAVTTGAGLSTSVIVGGVVAAGAVVASASNDDDASSP